MSILKKLKEVGLSIAVKLNMGETVKSMVMNDPSLVTPEMIGSAIKSGNKEALIPLLDANLPLNPRDSDQFIVNLGQTSLENYNKTASVLLSRNLIQKEGQFSDLLRVHSQHSQGTSNKKLDMILHDMTVNRNNPYQVTPDEVTKAVAENISIVSGDSLRDLFEKNKLIDLGDVYEGKIISFYDKAKMGLIGLAANANNFSAIQALESMKFSINEHDMIATRDFAARIDNRYQYEEKLAQASINNKMNDTAKELLKNSHFSGIAVNFDVPGNRGHSVNIETSAIPDSPLVKSKYQCPAELVPYKDDGKFSWHEYSPQDIKILAQRTSHLVDYQLSRASKELKDVVEEKVSKRFEIYQDTKKLLETNEQVITISPVHTEILASQRNSNRNTEAFNNKPRFD